MRTRKWRVSLGRQCRLSFPSSVLASILVPLVCASMLCAQESPTVKDRQLRSGMRIELAGGAEKSFDLRSKGRQFLRITAFQTGAEIRLSLFDEQGRVLSSVHSTSGPFVTESLFWISDAPSMYRIGISSNNPEASPAVVQIKLKRGKAGQNERLASNAQKLYMDAEALVAKGTQEDLKEARAKYSLAITATEKAGYADLEAEISNRYALTFLTTSEFDEVLKLENKAFALARRAHDRNMQELALLGMAQGFMGLMRYEDAQSRVDQALRMQGSGANRYLLAKVYYDVGGLFVYHAQYNEAIDYLNRALKIYVDLRLTAEQEDPLADLGVCYQFLGQYSTSMQYLQHALEVAQKTDNKAGERDLRETIAYGYQQQGDYALAIESFLESVRLSALAGDRRVEAIAHEELAYSYRLLGELDKALDQYQQALAAARELHDRGVELTAVAGIGACYRELGRVQEAITAGSAALKTAQELHDRQGEANILSGLALAYAAANRFSDAQSTLERSLTIHRELRSRAGEALALSNLSSAYLAEGNPQLAIEQATQALPIIRETSQLPEEGRALDVLMRAYEASGRLPEAIFFGKQAVNVLQGLRANVAPLGANSRRDFLAANAATYRKLADLLVSLGRLTEAEQVMDMLKEREFIDFLRGEDADSANGKVTFTPQEAALEKGYRELADRLVSIGAARSALIAKTNRTPADIQQLDSLDRDLEVGNRAYQRFLAGLAQSFETASASAGRVEQLQESQALMEDLRDLPAGTVIVYTLVGKERYREILITPDVQKAYEYPISDAQLSKKVFEFRELVQDPNYDPRGAGKDLYDILIRPLADDLRAAHANTVMWALDAGLRYLPLAALYDGHEYFIEQYDLAVFTPASYARFKDRPSRDWTAAGFGVTKGQPGAPALPFVEDELRAIISEQQNGRGVLPGEVSLDERFTKQSLRAAILNHYPVVHIASHFQFIPGNDLDSFLLLGDGSRLTLADVKDQPSLFGGLQLLTLSACNTGVGDNGGNGSEVEGLGVLAQRRGAKAVIASLWPVADSSTSILMKEFYRIRQGSAGITKVEALRRAQLELLGGAVTDAPPDATAHSILRTNSAGAGKTPALGDPALSGTPQFHPSPEAPYSHPFYWAAFFLMGNWL
jgi:CHAT domain-containing protein